MTAEERTQDGAIDPFQTGLGTTLHSAASLSLPADEEDYDSDRDSDRDSCTNKISITEFGRYTEETKSRSLLGKSPGLDTLARVSDRVCWNDEVLRESKGKSDSCCWLTKVKAGAKELKPEPGSPRVRTPSPYPKNSAKSNSSHLQYYSPPLHPRHERNSLATGPRRPNIVHHNLSPTSSSSSLTLNLDEHAIIEGPNRKALSELSIDQQVAMAEKQIVEAKKIIVKADSMKDERLKALEVMTDWNNVKKNAEQRKFPSPKSDTALHEQEGPAKGGKIRSPKADTAYHEQEDSTVSSNLKEKKPLRKRLSGFFKKAPAPTEANMTSKSALSIKAPIVKAEDTLKTAEQHSYINVFDTTDINAEASPDEGTSTIASSGSESSSDYDEAMEIDQNAPPMPPMPIGVAEAGNPEVKRNNRNIHIIGSSPDHRVIIDNTNAYFSPDKRHHRQPATIPKTASTGSGHDDCATTNNVAGKRSVTPLDADLISEHGDHSINDHHDNPTTPTRERRPQTFDAAQKRPERHSLKKGEQSAELDEDDAASSTRQSFDASAYSGDESSVHTAKSVHMRSHKATMVYIPARRGDNPPASINKDDPRNTALFSNPPNENIIRVEMEDEARKGLRAQEAAHKTIAKRLEDPSRQPKTKRTLASLKNAFKPQEANKDKCEEAKDKREEGKDKHGEGTEKKHEGGGSGNEGNGTARARMEGYQYWSECPHLAVSLDNDRCLDFVLRRLGCVPVRSLLSYDWALS